MKYIVSACLAGLSCRYDGKANPCQRVIDLIKEGQALPFCPEIFGGLSTPRPAAERKGSKVVTCKGQDVTTEFYKGALEGLKLAWIAGVREAILAARSPSCGSNQIYDGTFNKKLITGDGVFAQMLREDGFRVFIEEETHLITSGKERLG
ncbi:MAG: DUF523 domain-containing protein [bacterium]|nr:DUF523 domain-containing protein [bacterium]